MWVVLGLLLIDFLIGIFRNAINGSLSPNIVLDYLKNLLYHVFPLLIIVSLIPLDPSGWILIAFYYISGLGLIWYYAVEIIHKWRA